MQAGFINDTETLDEMYALRGEVVGAAASKVAVIQEVRAALLEFQRTFAQRKPGAVLDGRDIGTVICPDADVKFFITATSAARAQRRHKDAKASGGAETFEEIKADIEARDHRDANRSVAPTLAAQDAIVIDTTDVGADEALRQALAHIKKL